MTEKTEDQITREKAAVESLKGAKTNMQAALERIATLEQNLNNAIVELESAARQFHEYSFPRYNADRPETKLSYKEFFMGRAAHFRKVL